MFQSQAGENGHCQLETVPEKSVWTPASALGNMTAVTQGKTRKRKEENITSVKHIVKGNCKICSFLQRQAFHTKMILKRPVSA